MGIERIIEILECEKECSKHFVDNVDKNNFCHCQCDNCDFHIDEQEAITAYTLAISILKIIRGDRKVMSTTGEQNEFTIF